jgi:hypothetical protein
MISAYDANELVKQSELVVSRNLQYIDEKIKAKAIEGKRYLNLDELSDDIFASKKDRWHAPMLTPLLLVYYRKITEHGYMVKYVEETHTIGGGFKSMDDEATEEVWWHLRVSW